MTFPLNGQQPPPSTPAMTSPMPNVGTADSQRQFYGVGTGLPSYRFPPLTPLSSQSGGTVKETVIENIGGGGGGTTGTAWLLGGNSNGGVFTLGTNDAFDLPIVAGGNEQARAVFAGNGGFQVDNYFAYGGSGAYPSPAGRDTQGYVFGLFDTTLANPVNEFRALQLTAGITRTTPDTNYFGALTVPAAIPVSGTVNTNGTTTIAWASGATFNTGWAAGTIITINSVNYTIASVASSTSLTINTTIATHSGYGYGVGLVLSVTLSDLFVSGQVVQIGSENMTVNGLPPTPYTVLMTRSAGTYHPAGAGIFYVSGTIYSPGAGWDERPLNTAVQFDNLTLSDGQYRGSGYGIVSEFYYGVQGQTTDFSNPQAGIVSVLDEVDGTNRLWTWNAFLVGAPVTSTNSKITVGRGLWIENLDSGTLASDGVSHSIDDLASAAIEIDGLGVYSRILWPQIDLRSPTAQAISVHVNPVATTLTASVSATATTWPVALGNTVLTTLYFVGDELLCEGEIVQITGFPGSSNITVARHQRGTTASGHYGGVSPQTLGRPVYNLRSYQVSRWDGNAENISSLFVGAGDGVSSGRAIVLNQKTNVVPGAGGPGILNGATKANPVVFDASTSSLSIPQNGQSVTISGATGGWTGINGTWLVSGVSGASFSIAVDTTAYSGSFPSSTTTYLIPISSVAAFDYSVEGYTSLLVDGLSVVINGTSGGPIGLGSSVSFGSLGYPTGQVTVGAGNTHTAPIILTSGTLTGSVIPGALEYDGTNWWISNGVPHRGAIATTDEVWLLGGNSLSATGVFGSTNAHDVSMIAGGTEQIKMLAANGVNIDYALNVGGIVDTQTGYQVGNAAASGYFIRGNGTEGVFAQIQAGDISGIAWLLGGNTTGAIKYFGSLDAHNVQLGAGGNPQIILLSAGGVNIENTLFTLSGIDSHNQGVLAGSLSIGATSPGFLAIDGNTNIATTGWTTSTTTEGNLTVSGNEAIGTTVDPYTPLYINKEYTNATAGGTPNETAGIRCVMARLQNSTTGDSDAVISGDFAALLDHNSTQGISGDQIIGIRSELYIGGTYSGSASNSQVFGIIAGWGDPKFASVFDSTANINQWWGMYVGSPPTVSSGNITSSARGLDIEPIAANGSPEISAIYLQGNGNAGCIRWGNGSDGTSAGGAYLSANAAVLTATGTFNATSGYQISGTAGFSSGGSHAYTNFTFAGGLCTAAS